MARRAEAPYARRGPALSLAAGPRRGGAATLQVDDVPECTSCGACCFSTLPEYIRVFGCDYDRMDDRARALTHFIGNRCYMRIAGDGAAGRCAALALDPVANTLLCSIYEVRPDCCRALERGSGACRGELHAKRERPLIALEALRRR